jgi:uncharacterized membrane protein
MYDFRNQKFGGKKEMGTSFEYSKTLAMEGSILLTLGLVPYVGWVLGIIGVILLLRGMKEFANYYQDNEIYQNALTGVKYYIVALIALAAAGAGFVVGFVFNGFAVNGFPGTFGIGNAVGIAVGIAALVVAFVFYVLAATHLRRTFNTLAQKTGEHSFETAGTLLWIGSILTIIGVGVLLIFIAWIFAVVGFFAMKSTQQQPSTSQPYGYTPPTTTPPTQPTRFCPNCGAPVSLDATFCSRCGKQLPPS